MRKFQTGKTSEHYPHWFFLVVILLSLSLCIAIQVEQKELFRMECVQQDVQSSQPVLQKSQSGAVLLQLFIKHFSVL